MPTRDKNVTITRENSHLAKIQVQGNSLGKTSCWLTKYPDSLIQIILERKGSSYLIDEIMRDESVDYVQRALKWGLFSFVEPEHFSGKRLLDFGCGAGASTTILSRYLPNTNFVGVDLDDNLLPIARERAKFYNFCDRAMFLRSPSPKTLPNIGYFDYVLLSAVFEHLLPEERDPLLELAWSSLTQDGILFINQTPNRQACIEYHTTLGLPLLNYCPDWLAHFYSTRFSRNKNLRKENWDTLLRKGIRGATKREICKRLDKFAEGEYEFLNPSHPDITNDAELWYRSTSVLDENSVKVKKVIRKVAQMVGPLRNFILPTIIVAVRKKSMVH